MGLSAHGWTGEKDVVLTFENVREARLLIVKKDAQSGVSLAGAVFDVYADGKYLTSVTTNDAGEAYVTGIKGEMYIEAREKAAPEHYILDRSSYGIYIDPYDPAVEEDPVLTISHFAQNTVDCHKYICALKELGIAIIFRCLYVWVLGSY